MSSNAYDYGAAGAALFDIVKAHFWTRRRASAHPRRLLPLRERRRAQFANLRQAAKVSVLDTAFLGSSLGARTIHLALVPPRQGTRR